MSKIKNRTRRNTPFKEGHFNSNDGMLTTVWGPGMWHSLHTISFNYPVNPTCDEKRRYQQFILNLEYVLPCGKCRKNLKNNFKKLPLKWTDMKSRSTFSLYIYRLHELINKMLHKRSGLSYQDVRERYEHFRSRCTKSANEVKEVVMVKEKEDGCTEPLYGEKAKCVLNIVPQNTKCDTFNIDKKCIKRNLTKRKKI